MPRLDFKEEFDKVNAALLADPEAYLQDWLPGGKLERNEYIALNPNRNDSSLGSFKININKGGVWADNAIGEKGGDLISLYKYLNNLETQGKALKELKKKYGFDMANIPAAAKKADSDKYKDWQLIAPVPESAPPASDKIYLNEEAGSVIPSRTYAYKDANGNLLGYSYRFDVSDFPNLKKKEFRCRFFWRDENGFEKWWSRAPKESRPLYGLELLGKYPEKPVLLVSGEKCVEAVKWSFAQKHGKEQDWPFIPITWGFGDGSIKQTDFSPLHNREIVYWPDNDDSCRKTMAEIYRKYNGTSLLIEHDKKGWDVADLVLENQESKEFDLAAYIRAAMDRQKEAAPDLDEPAPYAAFPHKNSKGSLLDTKANMKALLNSYRMKISYNVISKKMVYAIGGKAYNTIDSANDFLSEVKSVCALNGLPKDNAKNFLSTIGGENAMNPVLTWIQSSLNHGLNCALIQAKNSHK